jgi:hypothetical protein
LLQDQRCFAADSLVTLADGNQKSIAQLQSGDVALAYDDKTKQVISTQLLTMLDFQPHQFGKLSHSSLFLFILSFCYSLIQTSDNYHRSTIITLFISSSSN